MAQPSVYSDGSRDTHKDDQHVFLTALRSSGIDWQKEASFRTNGEAVGLKVGNRLFPSGESPSEDRADKRTEGGSLERRQHELWWQVSLLLLGLKWGPKTLKTPL